MDVFLIALSPIYLVPITVVLALLLWLRTGVGLILTPLVIGRFVIPMLGGPVLVPVNVHIVVGFVVLTAWRWGEWRTNAALVALGLLFTLYTRYLFGHFLPDTTMGMEETINGVVVAWIIMLGYAGLSLVQWWSGKKKAPSTQDE